VCFSAKNCYVEVCVDCGFLDIQIAVRKCVLKKKKKCGTILKIKIQFYQRF
jgi:hypothetical protein